VELLWLSEGATGPHTRERLLPNGSMELVINLREDKMRVYDRQDYDRCRSLPGSIIVGAQSNYFVIDTDEQTSVAGVHFKPGGAFPFFKLPAGELRDEHVALDTLWGSGAADLREQLLAAKTPQEKFRILEHFLMMQAAKPLQRHDAVAYALGQFLNGPSVPSVGSVTDQIGLSARRFIQLFSDEVGLTPKLFCRVRRFQRVLRRVAKGQQIDWVGVALSCGYFDQAHFVHDFRAFSGLNPTTYLSQRTDHLNHVPILH
jgi:AraC-like DNA-binding protein